MTPHYHNNTTTYTTDRQTDRQTDRKTRPQGHHPQHDATQSQRQTDTLCVVVRGGKNLGS